MKRILYLTVLALLCSGLALYGLGSRRYGGPQGLMMRVKAEFQARSPEDQYMPTPLPTPAALVQASPTEPPPPTPSPTAVSPTSPTRAAAATMAPVAVSATSTTRPTATASPTQTALPIPTRTPADPPAPPAVELTGFTHVWQTWNNCGPASLVMQLSHYGVNIRQETAGAAVRPNKEDKHAGPEELAAYARTLGFQALARVNGNPDELRLLLSRGIPVILGTWHVNDKDVGMSHYRLLTGYSDARREWILYDSLESRGLSSKDVYRGIRISYEEMARLWAVMNRTYVLVWNDAQSKAVRDVVGADLDDVTMWRKSLAVARDDSRERPNDAFAWFTLGTNLVYAGQWQAAAEAYDRARVIGLPYRMLWYQFGPLRAYYEVGRFQELLALVDATIETTSEIEELHYWRGMGLWAMGDLVGARRELDKALSQRPSYAEPAAVLAKLAE